MATVSSAENRALPFVVPLLLVALLGLIAGGAEAASKPAWVRTFHEPGDGFEQACAVATDDAGAVYLAVDADRGEPTSQLRLHKYDVAGALVWTATLPYETPGVPWCFLEPDGDGNVILGGSAYSGAPGLTYSFVAAKYAPDGQRLWSRVLSPLEGETAARAMAVDVDGGVVVAGDFPDANSCGSWIIAQWTADGQPATPLLFDGPAALDDYLRAVAVDAEGGVLAAGTTCYAGSGWHCDEYRGTLVKFDAAGVQAWAAYVEEASWAEALVVDGLGDAYLLTTPSPINPSGAGRRLWKFGADGAMRWVVDVSSAKYFSAAASLALDPEGNPVVAAATDAGWLTTERDAVDGEAVWSATYVNQRKYVYPISDVFVSVDGSGVTRVAGGAFEVVAYDAQGEQLSAAAFGDPAGDVVNALRVLPGGAGVVAGAAVGEVNLDAFAVSFDAALQERGRVRWFGPGPADSDAAALALDDVGNVLVAGTSANTGRSFDFLVVRYSPAGQMVQTIRYDSPERVDDILHTMARNRAGDIYLVGAARLPDGDQLAVVKYDDDGAWQWTAREAAPASSTLGPTHFAAIDSASCLAVAGSVYRADEKRNLRTYRFSPAGALLWSAEYDGLGFDDAPRALAVDRDNNLIVLAESDPEVYASDFVTAKYSPDGDLLWAQRYDGWTYDSPRSVAVDDVGGVYVAGSAGSGNWPESDFVVLKYDEGGSLAWERRWADASATTDEIEVVALDSGGGLWALGAAASLVETPYSFVVVASRIEVFRLDRADGGTLTATHYPSLRPVGIYTPTAAAVDASGNLWAAGHTRTAFVAAQFDLQGGVRGEWSWRQGVVGSQDPRAIAASTAGAAYLAGALHDEHRGSSMITMKFSGGSASDDDDNDDNDDDDSDDDDDDDNNDDDGDDDDNDDDNDANDDDDDDDNDASGGDSAGAKADDDAARGGWCG